MYKYFYKKLKDFYVIHDKIRTTAEAESYWLSNFSFKASLLYIAYDLSCGVIKALRASARTVYVETQSIIR